MQQTTWRDGMSVDEGWVYRLRPGTMQEWNRRLGELFMREIIEAGLLAGHLLILQGPDLLEEVGAGGFHGGDKELVKRTLEFVEGNDANDLMCALDNCLIEGGDEPITIEGVKLVEELTGIPVKYGAHAAA